MLQITSDLDVCMWKPGFVKSSHIIYHTIVLDVCSFVTLLPTYISFHVHSILKWLITENLFITGTVEMIAN